MDAHQQREIASSVITRLSKFASSRVARRILGQRRSTGDLREVVRHGKLMLAELCKYGGGFALAIQWLVYLDRLDRTLRATVLANNDHPFPSTWPGRIPVSCKNWTASQKMISPA